jgi:hypothetical protein
MTLGAVGCATASNRYLIWGGHHTSELRFWKPRGRLNAIFSHLVSNKPTNHRLFRSGQAHGQWETSHVRDIVLRRTACGLIRTSSLFLYCYSPFI